MSSHDWPEPAADYLERTSVVTVSDPARRRFACLVADLAPGTSMTVKGDVPVALYRNDKGEFFATADTCTHEAWSLGTDSDLDGDTVTCPLHTASFDLRTGRPLCLPATIALATYAVEVDDDGKVYIVQ